MAMQDRDDRCSRSGKREVLVSVLMITYNHEQYIEKAMQSVLSQRTDFEFELVIGEDCSTDRTREIVDVYSKNHRDKIRVVTSDKNVGGNRNSARVRDAAMGTYFAWCEGDDWWKDPEKLQKQIDVITQDPGIGMVYCDLDEYRVEDGRTNERYVRSSGRPISENPSIEDILWGRAGILTCTVLARADLVRSLCKADYYLYNSGKFPMGDTQLWAELASRSRIKYMDESMSVRNLLLESASQSKDPVRGMKFSIANHEMCAYLCEKHSLSKELKDFHEKQRQRLMFSLASIEGDSQTSSELLRNEGWSLRGYLFHLAAKYKMLRNVLSVLRRLRDPFR